MQNTESPTAANTSPESAPRSNRSAMMIVFLVVFIDLLGFGIVLPLLPRIAKLYVVRVLPVAENGQQTAKASPDAAAQSTRALSRANPKIGFIVGMLMSSFSLMQFLFAPVWGRLSDRIGRRPILLLGLTGSVVFYGLFGYAASLSPDTSAPLALALFFVARIGAGIAGATIATAQAVIADCTPPEKRKHGMALIGVAFGIGFTFGPLIGFGCLGLQQYFPDLGHEIIGYSAAALSFIALLLGLRLLPETRVVGQESAVRRNWFDRSALRFALINKAIGPVILTFFMASLGFGAFEVTLALFLEDNFQYGERESFLIFAYIGFVLMLTQGVLYRRLASRVSEVTFMGFGIFFMALGVALMGAISYSAALAYAGEYLFPALVLALTCAVVGFAFLTPSAQALVSRRTPDDRQGEILGVNQSASAMARILGPVFGLSLYESTETHLLPYIAGAALLLLMFPMLPLMRRGG